VSARQHIVATSFFLLIALFSVFARDAARAQERWPPWQSYTEAEEAARQKALKRKAAAATAANNPANIRRQIDQLKAAGKLDQAVALGQKLIAIAERKGPQSVELADALDTLASVYEAQNKFADAEPLLHRSLTIREKTAGQPGLAQTRDRLAAAYDKQGKTGDAEALRTAAATAPAQDTKPAAPAGSVEVRRVEPSGGSAAPPPEASFKIPSADAPKNGAAPPAPVAEVQPRSEAPPVPEAGENEPFSIPPADAPAGGAASPSANAGKTEEKLEVRKPSFGAPLQSRGSRFTVAPPDAPAGAESPPPAAAAPTSPAPQADGEDSRDNRTDIIAEPMPKAAQEAPAVPEPSPQPPLPGIGAGSGAPPPAAAPAQVPEPPVVAEPAVPDGRAAAPDASGASGAPPPDMEGGGGQRRAYHSDPGERASGAPSAPAPPPAAAPSAAARAPAAPDPVGGAAPLANPDWQLVPVYWGTDRAVQPNAQRLAFGSDRARKLQLGVAQITVPKVHEVPNVERPWVVKIPYFDVTLYAQSEDPKKHFTVKEIKALTKEELLAQVKERLKNSKLYKDQAFVFVHGYNTSFDNALYRTAQIAYDLDFDGAPFLYSWPSGGAVASYTYDRESAQQSEPYLRQYLEMIIKETGAKQISIIAHSMGNQPVMDVLRDMRNAAPEGVEISQVILAAPDVDADAFTNLAGAIKGLAKNVTLYVAANDRALIVSRNFWGSYRAGDVPPAGPLILPGIDTIDVTAVTTDVFAINHSGYASNSKLLDDVGELLKTGLRPPEMRALKPGKVTIGAGDYWRYLPVPQ
jgi:esterase/lipase superfamily enzyme